MSKYLFGFTEKTTEPADSELLVGGTGTASDYTFKWSNLALWIKSKLFGTSTVWTSDNDGVGSGLDADTLQNETPATLRNRALHTGDAPGVNISVDTNLLNDKTLTNVQLLAQKVDSNPASYIPQGSITVAADFPLIGSVQAGWLYTIEANVTDNDATKTNTLQSFLAGVSIVWSADGSWLDLGSNYITQAQIDKLDLGANFVKHIDLTTTAITPFEGAVVTPDVDGVYPNYNNLERKNELCNFVYTSGEWTKKTISKAGEISAKKVFQGDDINSNFQNFLLDIEVDGFDKNKLYLVEVNRNNSTTGWKIYFAYYDSGRIYQSIFTGGTSYAEPDTDSNGRIIDTIDIPEYSGSGTSIKVIVDWSAITDGGKVNVYSNYKQGWIDDSKFLDSISKNNIKDLELEVNVINQSMQYPFGASDTILTSLKNGFLDVEVYDYDDVNDLFIKEVSRNYTGGGSLYRVVVAKKNDPGYTSICQFASSEYTEPNADSEGRIVDLLDMVGLLGEGVTGRILIDWNEFTDGSYLNLISEAGIESGLLSSDVFSKTIQRELINDLTSNELSVIETITPKKVYSIYNANGPKMGFNFYLDHYIKLTDNTKNDLRFDNKSDKISIYPDTDGSNVYNDVVSATVESNEWNANDLLMTHKSSKSSLVETSFPKVMGIGDSQTYGEKSGLYTVADQDGVWWLRMVEYMKRLNIDKGSGFDYLSVGNILNYNRDFEYEGGSYNVSGCANGVSGTSILSWMRHTELSSRMRDGSQGGYDLMGLGDGTGADWTGSQTQKDLYVGVSEGQNSPILTGALYEWLGLGVATSIDTNITAPEQAAITAATQERLDNPHLTHQGNAGNPYFDRTLTGIYRFSIDKYLERYKTLDTDGITRLLVGSTAGTEVTDANDYDVMLPTHVIFKFSENERSAFGLNQTGADNYAAMMQVATDAVHAEYPNIYVGLGACDNVSTFFNDLYPNVVVNRKANANIQWLFNRALFDQLYGSGDNEETNKQFMIPIWWTQPTALGWALEKVESPESDNNYIVNQTNDTMYYPRYSDTFHPGYLAHASWGYQALSWITYTYNL